MRRSSSADLRLRRLAREHGIGLKQAPFPVALAFACPYRLGTSALGPMQIYRRIQAEPGMACERIYLPDEAGSGPLRAAPTAMESGRPLGEFPVVGFTVAWELELGAVAQMLDASGIGALRATRDERQPLVVAGGPLTYANPLPLAAFADAIVLGEADEIALDVLRTVRDASDRAAALAALATLPGVYVPALHGETLPQIGRAPSALLPAWSPLWTPESELASMFLIEAVRGCARSCTYCVMRRGAGAGMRIVPASEVLDRVPPDAPRVGLVGAGVSDHPEIAALVGELARRGHQVGLSSLRPERLDEELVRALAAAGARSLTVALDGASDRLRAELDRRCDPRDVVRAATHARAHGFARLKLYVMVGLPTETDDDLGELAQVVEELSRLLPVSVAASPFCAKRNTPLAGQPYAGIDVVNRRLMRLRTELRGRADLRAASARWAWVEHSLAQGDEAAGRAVRDAVQAGGSFQAFRHELSR
jgi:hypothetical protein